MRWLFKLLPRRLRPKGRGAAHAAAVSAERKLMQARQDWPKVVEAHNDLATWFDAAMRGGR